MSTRLGLPYREFCQHKLVKVSSKWKRCVRCNSWVPSRYDSVPVMKKKNYSDVPDSPAIAEARQRVKELFDRR